MAHELEEERRRDQFYDIDPALNDDEYFKELGAKDEALVRLTTRLQTQADLAAALVGMSSSKSAHPGEVQVRGLRKSWCETREMQGACCSSRLAASVILPSYSMAGDLSELTQLKTGYGQ